MIKSTFTLILALMIWSAQGCADGDGSLPMSGEEAGMMAGDEAQGGQQAGVTAGVMSAGQIAGTQMAGTPAGTQAGAQAGAQAGVQMGGTQSAGMQMGGEMIGGVPAGEMAGTPGGGMAGMTAGDDMPGGAQMVGDPCDMIQPDPTLPCAVTIYEARNPARVALNRVVTVEGTATALRSGDEGVSHVVLQVSPQDPQYQGPAWSAIWVYLNDAEVELVELSVGQNLSVTAELSDFFGQRQLKKVSALVDLGDAPLQIEPFGVNASDVATNGALAESYEGLLVSVAPVEVTEVNPLPGPGDREPTQEFVINGVLRVNDFITSLAPLPQIGDSWGQITGILRLGNGDFKLEPRDAQDIGRPIPQGDPSQLLINEVDYSQPGADEGEFVEIMNGGVEPAPLLGVTLELVNGSNNSAYGRYELVNAAEILAPGEMIVVGSDTILNSLPANVGGIALRDAIQNGPDGVRIVHNALGVIDELGYEELSLSEGQATVADPDSEDDTSIGRCGVDSDNNAADFFIMSATPGATNICR